MLTHRTSLIVAVADDRELRIIGGECVAVKGPARYRADPWRPLIDCSTAQTPSAGSPATAGPTAAGSAADLVEADEGNQIPMTSLEGVPHGAVVGVDLHVGVAVGSRGLPLFTLANGMLMARRPWWARAFTAPEAADPIWRTCAADQAGYGRGHRLQPRSFRICSGSW